MSTIRMGKDIGGPRPDSFKLITDRFIHTITRDKRSIKPPECRGGILADEMGMV